MVDLNIVNSMQRSSFFVLAKLLVNMQKGAAIQFLLFLLLKLLCDLSSISFMEAGMTSGDAKRQKHRKLAFDHLKTQISGRRAN